MASPAPGAPAPAKLTWFPPADYAKGTHRFLLFEENSQDKAHWFVTLVCDEKTKAEYMPEFLKIAKTHGSLARCPCESCEKLIQETGQFQLLNSEQYVSFLKTYVNKPELILMKEPGQRNFGSVMAKLVVLEQRFGILGQLRRIISGANRSSTL